MYIVTINNHPVAECRHYREAFELFEILSDRNDHVNVINADTGDVILSTI